MSHLFQLVGPRGAVQILGVRLVGVNAENGKKLLFSLIFLLLLLALSKGLSWLVRKLVRGRDSVRVTFWTPQAIHLATAVILVVGLVSIWFDDPPA